MTGPVGCGKTIRAASILLAINEKNYIENKHHTYAFVDVPKLLLELKNSFSIPGAEAVIIKKYVDMDYLILDDIGVERTSEWVYQVLYLIVNARYENLKPIITTGNLPLNKLADKLGDDRITSRLFEMCDTITIKGTDYRTK